MKFKHINLGIVDIDLKDPLDLIGLGIFYLIAWHVGKELGLALMTFFVIMQYGK